MASSKEQGWLPIFQQERVLLPAAPHEPVFQLPLVFRLPPVPIETELLVLTAVQPKRALAPLPALHLAGHSAAFLLIVGRRKGEGEIKKTPHLFLESKSNNDLIISTQFINP